MKAKIFLVGLMIQLISAGLNAQGVYGTLSGSIKDDSTGEYLSFASLSLTQNGQVKYQAISDEKGFYSIKPIVPGVYDLTVSMLSYRKKIINQISINANSITMQNVSLKLEGITIGIIDIEPPAKNLIEPDKVNRFIIDSDGLKTIPLSNLPSIVNLTPGVTNGFFRGQRLETTAYYVDGVKITGEYPCYSILLLYGTCKMNAEEKTKKGISTKIVPLKQKTDSQGKTNRIPNVKRFKHLSSGWQQTIIGLSVTIIIAVVGWSFFSSEKTSNQITNTTVNVSGENSGDIAGRDINSTIVNNYAPNDKTSSSEKPREVDPSEDTKLSVQKDNDKLTEARLKVSRLIEDFDTAINDAVENYSKEVNRIKQNCGVAGMFDSGVHIDMQVENVKIHKKKLDDACKTLDRGTEDIMLEKFKDADIGKIPDMCEESNKIKGIHQKYEKAKKDFEENVRKMNRELNHNRPIDFN